MDVFHDDLIRRQSPSLHSYLFPIQNFLSVVSCFMISIFSMISHVSNCTLCRQLLHPLLLHHHDEHMPPQHQRQGQTFRGTVHLHESKHWRRRKLSGRTAQGEDRSAELLDLGSCFQNYFKFLLFTSGHLRKHKKWASEVDRRQRQRPHADILQPRQGGLALETRQVEGSLA